MLWCMQKYRRESKALYHRQGRHIYLVMFVISGFEVSVAHRCLPSELAAVMLLQIEALEDATRLCDFRRQFALDGGLCGPVTCC